jgi:Fe-S cluster biogenesis protein NfuA
MSTEREDSDDLRERVNGFLERNFPQIWMHGGTAAIEDLDPETGEVSLRLGGACSGCGISPMTVQAIKSRMAKEIPEIQTVHANATGGMGGTGTQGAGSGTKPSRGTADEGEDSDLPF